MKSRFTIILICGFMIFSLIGYDRISANTPPVPNANSVINLLEERVDRFKKIAIERLDLALLKAAMETRAIILATRVRLSTDKEQNSLVQNLNKLNSVLSLKDSDFSKNVRPRLESAITDIRSRMSKKPGVSYILANPAFKDEGNFEIEIHGANLSGAQLNQLSIYGFPITIKPELQHSKTDHLIVYRVNMGTFQANVTLRVLIENAINRRIGLPITLSFNKNSSLQWTLSSHGHGPFVATALILPKPLVEVRAVFSVTTTKQQRRRQRRGPFHSARVRTRISGFPPRIKRGRRTDTWSVSPSDGWKIDPETAKYDFRLLFDGCGERDSSASWIQKTEHILKVRVSIAAEGAPGKTCRATTTISFMEWRGHKVHREVRTEPEKLSEDMSVKLKLDRKKYPNAHLAHVVVRSPGVEEWKKYPISSLPPYLNANYNHKTQSVDLKAKYMR